MKDSCLSELQRAEDIILGGLGLDSSFKIKEISATKDGFKGLAFCADDLIEFKNEFPLDSLDSWALSILIKGLK